MDVNPIGQRGIWTQIARNVNNLNIKLYFVLNQMYEINSNKFDNYFPFTLI